MSTKKSKKHKKKKSKKASKEDKDVSIEKKVDEKGNKSDEKSRKREHSRSRSKHKKKRKSDEDRTKKDRKSRSPETHYHHHYHHYHKSSRSRSNSRSRRKGSESGKDKSYKRLNSNDTDDKTIKIDKKKLLEIAKANVINASLQLQYTNINTTMIKIEDSSSSGSQQKGQTKTINELVEYCKKLSNNILTNDNDEENDNKIYHPYEMKVVPFNIKLDGPIKDPNTVEPTKEIHTLFPVSSGSTHRNKEHVVNEQAQISVGLEVATTTANENNNSDFMQEWVNSKQIPGQFTGSMDAKFLAPHELEGQYIAWARKDLMTKAMPIHEDNIGKKLLEKMGWRQGEGLGRKKEGSIVPLALDIKTDRKGLISNEDIIKSKTMDLSNFPESKHPINTLIELCKIRKWPTPIFDLVSETGPPHLRVFLMKTIVNNIEYQPATGSSNKKMAKTNAAIVCLQSLGILNQ